MISFVVAVIVGVGVGVLSGMLGIGGGTIMVPLYRLAFGLSPIGATATSLFTIIPTSLAGMAKHVRNKTSIPALGVATGVVGACFSPLGVWAAAHSEGWLIMLAAAGVIVYSSTTMFRKAFARIREDRAAKEAAAHEESGQTNEKPQVEGAPDDDTPFVFTRKRVAQIVATGIVAGLLGGFVGVGGGFIMVPMFVSLLGVPMRKASGSSLIAVCILALPAVIEQAVLGNVHYVIGLAMALGTMPGSWIGAGLVKRVPEAALRLMFAVFLIIAAIFLVVNEFVFVG